MRGRKAWVALAIDEPGLGLGPGNAVPVLHFRPRSDQDSGFALHANYPFLLGFAMLRHVGQEFRVRHERGDNDCAENLPAPQIET